MPRRNTTRKRLKLTLYHVYNRELTRGPMFLDKEDKREFKRILRRHLSPEQQYDSRGRPYRQLRPVVRLAALALCTTHFHLVLFQITEDGMEALMRSVMAAYVQYFNRRHGREQRMFNGDYRSRPLLDRRDKQGAISYVHENHGDDCFCEFCSHRWYAGDGDAPDWIDVGSGLGVFGGVRNYLEVRWARRRLRELSGGGDYVEWK